jgi:hypothetical protein
MYVTPRPIGYDNECQNFDVAGLIDTANSMAERIEELEKENTALKEEKREQEKKQ